MSAHTGSHAGLPHGSPAGSAGRSATTIDRKNRSSTKSETGYVFSNYDSFAPSRRETSQGTSIKRSSLKSNGRGKISMKMEERESRREKLSNLQSNLQSTSPNSDHSGQSFNTVLSVSNDDGAPPVPSKKRSSFRRDARERKPSRDFAVIETSNNNHDIASYGASSGSSKKTISRCISAQSGMAIGPSSFGGQFFEKEPPRPILEKTRSHNLPTSISCSDVVDSTILDQLGVFVNIGFIWDDQASTLCSDRRLNLFMALFGIVLFSGTPVFHLTTILILLHLLKI